METAGDGEAARRLHGYFNANLAKEIARQTGWKDKVWSRRYQEIVISDEEEAQMARLQYVLAHGVKENLVARVEEWPGVHCALSLMTGSSVEGTWYNRTLEYNAFLRGKTLEKGESASREKVYLSPLPCWKHLSENVYRARIADMVREINESGAAARRVRDSTSGQGGCLCAEPGDPSQEDQEIAGAVLPCPAEESPQGAVGGLQQVHRGLP